MRFLTIHQLYRYDAAMLEDLEESALDGLVLESADGGFSASELFGNGRDETHQRMRTHEEFVYPVLLSEIRRHVETRNPNKQQLAYLEDVASSYHLTGRRG